MKKLLITDLDDTLYSWINFFVPAFYEMVDALVNITGIEKNVLINEYKTRPFAQKLPDSYFVFSTVCTELPGSYPNLSGGCRAGSAGFPDFPDFPDFPGARGARGVRGA